MTSTTVVGLMLVLSPRADPARLLPVAEAIVESCKKEGAWAGKNCAPALVTVFWHESRFVPAPRHRNTARGVGQVLPNTLLRWRGKTRRIPTGKELEQPMLGVRWSLRVLEAKHTARCGGKKVRWPCVFAGYAGSGKRAWKASREFMVLFGKVRRGK